MRIITSLSVAALLWGCGSKPETPKGTDQAPSLSAPDAGQVSAAALAEERRPGQAKPPTLAELKPQVSADAVAGTLPRTLLLSFSEPVVARRHRKAGKTQVEIEPSLPHTLRFRDPYTLEVRLKSRPELGATYRVGLKALDSRWGLIEAAGEAPGGTVTMPGFTLVQSIYQITKSGPRLQLDFSAKPQNDALRDHLKIAGDGLPLDGWSASSQGTSMTINLPRLALAANTISVELTEGLPSEDGAHRAPGFATLHAVARGKAVQILGVGATASADGFGIDIICHDLGGGTKRNWFWHDSMSRSFRTGPRCQPDAQGRSAISVEPKQDFRIVPGRGGFRLLGDFSRGKLRVRIASGMTTVDGGVTTSDHVSIVDIGARPGKLEFVESGRYLPRSAWKALRFKHRNVGEVELEVRQIRPDNLAFWLSGDSELADQRSSDVVLRKALRVEGESDKEATGRLDVAQLIDQGLQGVLQLTLRAPGVDASTRILVTDLNLLAKRSLVSPVKDGLPAQHRTTVWALGAHDHGPQSGVSMELLAPSGRAISQCVSDATGRCELDGPAPDAVDRASGMAVVARRGDEITYLRFSDLKLQYNDQHIGGEAYRSTKPYRGFVYGDRDLYRPGETMQFVAAIRGADGRPPKSGLPVELRISDARSRVSKHILSTNDAGLTELSLPLNENAPTGAYRAQLRVADQVLTTYRFNVEEFMPERMRVEVKLDTPIVAGAKPHRGLVSAAYLFGGSAEGSPVRVTCRYRETTLSPKGFDSYSFSPWQNDAREQSSETVLEPKSLDADGRVQADCAQSAGGHHPLRLTVEAAVQEAGSGRTTRGSASATWLPEPFQLGITSAIERASANRQIPFKAVILDLAGKASSSQQPVTVTLFRIEEEYSWGYDEDSDRWSYDHRRHLVEEGKTTIKPGDSGGSLSPGEDAPKYLLRATAGKAQADLVVEGTGSRYWWSRRRRQADRTPKPERPVQINIELPEAATVGQSVPVRFEAPFAGRALLTVETDELLHSAWADVSAGPQTLNVPVERFAPNVYVNLLLLKDPHVESAEAYVPGRGLGVASLTIEPTEQRQNLTISLPDEIQPNSELPVRVDLGPGAAGRRVTIAAVDQGILNLTRYKTPNPLSAFFAKRRLGVDSYETVGWNLLMPAASPASGKGGGVGGRAGLGRVQPTKPVALWSGLLEVPIDGKLEHRFKVPRYRGELRVMVVAVGPQRIGSAEATVPVREPLVLMATLPKQLSQGDSFFVPVAVTNLSGRAQQVTVRMSAEGLDLGGGAGAVAQPLRFLGPAEQPLTLAKDQSGTVRFEAMALRAVGAATLKVSAEAGTLRSVETLDVPFTPQAPRSRLSQMIALQPGDNDLTAAFKGWLPTTERSTLWVTTNPYAKSFGHLEHLVRYPYGCIEQTVSSSRPLLFSGLMLKRVTETEKDVPAMIEAGIERVLSMQTGAGGFAYWPGGSEPNLWGTAYATHFLLDAKKRGIAVPNDRLDDAVTWLESQADEAEGRAYHRRQAGHALSTEAYVQYTLARAGKGRTGRMKALLKQANTLPAERMGEAKAALWAGLYIAGDRSHEAALRKPDLSAIGDQRSNSWSFYSALRGRAMTMALAADLFPKAPELEPLARLLAGRLERASRYYTTQELAWAITGLGLRAGRGGSVGSATLTVGGSDRKPEGKEDMGPSWALIRTGEQGPVSLKLDGGDGERYAIINSDGVRLDADWATGDHGLAVRRSVMRVDGGTVDPAQSKIKLGEMLAITLTVQNLTGTDQENIAVVDRLPAGFEIEAASSLRGFRQRGKGQWKIAHRNTRDDRIELFGRLRRNQAATFTYSVRAVTAGQFRQPPVEAEAMYDPTLWSRQLGGSMRVVGPWQNED